MSYSPIIRKRDTADALAYAPLPAEEVPMRVHGRLAEAAAVDQGGCSSRETLSHAEQKRVEAAIWNAQNSKSGRVLRAFREVELDGCLKDAVARHQRATTEAEAAFWDAKREAVLGEIKRRSKGGFREPLTQNAAPNSFPVSRKKPKRSPGRPPNISKRAITLPHVRPEKDESQQQDTACAIHA
jgi:hypothetical protein